MTEPRKLRVFLCHALQDKSIVKNLSQSLNAENWISSWTYEEEKIMDRENRKYKIMEWLESANIILVCLTNNSVKENGMIEESLSEFLDAVDSKFRGDILLIPVRLENVLIPQKLKNLKYLDLFSDNFEPVYHEFLQKLRQWGEKQEKLQKVKKRKEIQRIKQVGKLISLFLRIRDAIEEMPVLFRTKLRVLVCAPQQDSWKAQEIYERLKTAKWITSRLITEKKQKPRDWEEMMRKTVRSTDVVLLCLSSISISQKGYFQPEFSDTLRWIAKRNKGKIYIIPLRLDESVPPLQFQLWRWLDYFSIDADNQLFLSLDAILQKLGVIGLTSRVKIQDRFQQGNRNIKYSSDLDNGLEIFDFIKVSADSSNLASHKYWIAKYPINCAQYERFLRSKDYLKDSYWSSFPKYDENGNFIGKWQKDELEYIDIKKRSKMQPFHWIDSGFYLLSPNSFIRSMTWYEANAYCQWLTENWENLQESNTLRHFDFQDMKLEFRLPLEKEWIAGIKFGNTKPPKEYLGGKILSETMYVPSSLKEWLANYSDKEHERVMMYYGHMYIDEHARDMARLGYSYSNNPWYEDEITGFRVLVELKKRM